MERLQAFSESEEISTARQHFIGMPSAPRLVKDNTDASNIEGDCQQFSCQLNRDISLQLLQILPEKTSLPTPVWLLTTLMQALYNCTNQSAHCFELVHHGRRDALPDTDLSRTCGWMSINYPAYFAIDPQADTVSQARSIQANLAALTHHGLGYGLFRFMHPDREVRKQFEDLPQPEMKFMWYGQSQGMVQTLVGRYPVAPETVGVSYNDDAPLHYLQYFYGAVKSGCIHLDVMSSVACFTDETRQNLLSQWQKCIEDLAHL
jgi:non-ribosomal peptide synthase protein (TIGR01720 family)